MIRKVGYAIAGLFWTLAMGPDPISSAASTMAKEGARQRRQTFAEKQATLHARLRGAVEADRARKAEAA